MSILLNRDLTNLDKFVLDIVKVIESCGEYVIVSGYVAIALGRSRGTEDIDFLFSGDFECINSSLEKSGFYCINGDSVGELIKKGIVPRIARKGEVIPNAEIKPPKDEFDYFSLSNKTTFGLRKTKFFISPINLQIAYKLWLGSEKDFEDAVFIYESLKEKVNLDKVLGWAVKLGVKDAKTKIREILG